MKKKSIVLMMAVILAISLLVGCGGATEKADSYTANQQIAEVSDGAGVQYDKANQGSTSEAKDYGAVVTTTSKDEVKGNAIAGGNTTIQTTSNAILSQRKMIRNANVTVEVDDFDIAYGKIKSIISNIGIVQESNIKKEKIFVDSKEKLITKGVIVLRVDKDKFDSVIAGLGGLGLLIDESIKTDDVTDKFFDTESRLRLLKFEENRLEQYLNKLNDPDVIFKTESRLTDIRHEIEALTGNLKKMNDLVELSTITVNLVEKSAATSIEPAKEKSYWERLFGGFVDSFKGVLNFCGELIILLAQALPVLALLVILSGAALLVYRKFFKKALNNINKNNDKDTGL
ncbi:MAG: DUF4349 domain-containing protein [Clostridia bacterium]|nr:DUF4349 domain-containing protein [Clostridia bacterium]